MVSKENWRSRVLAEAIPNELWQLDLEKQELCSRLRTINKRIEFLNQQREYTENSLLFGRKAKERVKNDLYR